MTLASEIKDNFETNKKKGKPSVDFILQKKSGSWFFFLFFPLKIFPLVSFISK